MARGPLFCLVACQERPGSEALPWEGSSAATAEVGMSWRQRRSVRILAMASPTPIAVMTKKTSARLVAATPTAALASTVWSLSAEMAR